MAITIDFTASVDSDVSKVRVWESITSTGEYSNVYEQVITQADIYVTYSGGSAAKWYKISFLDSSDNESAMSVAIYGGGLMWKDYMVSLMRTEIDDWSSPQRNTDLILKKKLVVAAHQVYQSSLAYVPFTYAYTFTIDSGDGSAWDVVPDPIFGSKDVDFVDLWLLKALCNDAKSGMSKAASNAIKIKDGDSAIDTSAGLGGYKALLESEGSACKAYKEGWNRYAMGQQRHSIYTNFGSDLVPSSYVKIDRT